MTVHTRVVEKTCRSMSFALMVALLSLGAINGCNNSNDDNDWFGAGDSDDSDEGLGAADPNAGIYPNPQNITPFVGDDPRKLQFWDLTYSWTDDPDGGTGTCTKGNVQIMNDELQVTQTAAVCPDNIGQVTPCNPQAGEDDQGNNVVASGAVQQSAKGCIRDGQGVANCSATPVSGPTDALTCQQAVEREDPLAAGAVWYQRLAGIPPGTSANYWWGKAFGAQGGEANTYGGTQMVYWGDSESAISVAASGGGEYSKEVQPIYMCNSATADVTNTDDCGLSSLFGTCLKDGQNCRINNLTEDADGFFNVYFKSAPAGGGFGGELDSIEDTLTELYRTDGLVFRGLECPGPLDIACIKNEIDGPHETDLRLKQNQGATTYLDSTMNPFFYTDMTGSQAVVLVFKSTIIDSARSCGYIQDNNKNGCGGDACKSYSGQFAEYNQGATPRVCSAQSPKPSSDFICEISGSDLKTKLTLSYNNFIKDFHDAVDKSDKSDEHSVYGKAQRGCILMKENQVSSFWSKETAIDDGDLLAIGFIYTQGTEQKYSDLLTAATAIQTIVYAAYQNEIPIVEINRMFKESSSSSVTNIINNRKIYFGIFEPLTFAKPAPPAPTPPTPTGSCGLPVDLNRCTVEACSCEKKPADFCAKFSACGQTSYCKKGVCQGAI